MSYDREYYKTYYEANKEKYHRQSLEWAKNNRSKVNARKTRLYWRKRDMLNEMKATTPCVDCGLKYPAYVMDFHHRDSEEKSFNIGNSLAQGVETLMREVAKCDVICSNCHRIRTWLAK